MIEITGNMIKAARALPKVTTAEFAKTCGLGISTIQNLEHCRDKPIPNTTRTDTVHKLIAGAAKCNVMFVDRGVRFIRNITD